MLLLTGLLLLSIKSFSVNPNFHIYLCFGQSNMEGQGAIENQDKTVDSRFKVLQSLDCSSRNKGTWYTAIPPLCQCNTGLSPADYFGRTMVKYLPDSVTVGVINVAIGGCDIRMFDKDLYQGYLNPGDATFSAKVQAYGGNSLKHFMDLAKLAQQDGVIKGILLHQGEANTGNTNWPSYVKKVYNDMLSELSLSADTVPLLSGEVLYTGMFLHMNPIVNQLPGIIPTAHIISAEGLTGDWGHFTSDGYRKLGTRYAAEMLSLMGVKTKVFEPENYYYEPECWKLGANWNIFTDKSASNNNYVTIKPGMNNTTAASTDSANAIYFDFTAKTDTTFYVYARVNCATLKSDSYWFKMDDGSFEYVNGLPKGSWTWAKVKTYNLKAGHHTLAIANGEEGAKLDKIYISNVDVLPTGMGDQAVKAFNPVVYSVPGKIEAESFSYQLWVLSETTTDIDGVSDVTNIDTDDFMEYLVNVPTDTIYKATFRYASSVSNGAASVLLDELSVGSISLPNTGGLYKSATKDIALKAGRHTLKLNATTGGFKLNWFMLEKVKATGIEYVLENGLSVFPNPTNGELNIKSDAFQFSNVAIFDCAGRQVFSRKFGLTNYTSFNPQLQKGVYFLNINNNQTPKIKIIID